MGEQRLLVPRRSVLLCSRGSAAGVHHARPRASVALMRPAVASLVGFRNRPALGEDFLGRFFHQIFVVIVEINPVAPWRKRSDVARARLIQID